MQLKYKLGSYFYVSVGKENPRTYHFNPLCDVSIVEDMRLILEHTQTKNLFELVDVGELPKELSNKSDNLYVEENKDFSIKKKSDKLENVCAMCQMSFKTKSSLMVHQRNIHLKKNK